MSDLYEVLEICLQEIEQGADIDTVLFRYPALADELRPILEASVSAKSMVVPEPSAEVVRRNRARVLQRAANMREAGAGPSSRRLWFASLRRIAVTLAVIAVLFISSTNLVRAASTTLPGDNLYPVKRTWEDVLLLFTFDIQQRATLEREHENKRLHELRELFAQGRSADVDFAGVVTLQNGNEWLVSGVRVMILPDTELRDGPIVQGSAVRVRGETRADGVVLAERVRLLPPDAVLPDVDDDDSGDKGDDGENEKEDDNSGKGSGEEETEDDDNSGPGSGNESSDDGSDEDNSGSGSVDNSDDREDSTDNNGNDENSRDDNSGKGGGNDDNNSDEPDDDSGGGDDNSGAGGGGADDD